MCLVLTRMPSGNTNSEETFEDLFLTLKNMGVLFLIFITGGLG